MGDAENALPPSKKRAAGRELTKDTSVDDEEDVSELETGTFKRASDEVLATRRIVKVRRQQNNSVPSSNPFAGIRLSTPTDSSANPVEPTSEKQPAGENNSADDSNGSGATSKDSEKAKDAETKQLESKIDTVEHKSAANNDAAEESKADQEHATEKDSTVDKSEGDKEHSEDVNKNEVGDKKDAAGKEVAVDSNTGNEDKKDSTDNGDNKDEKAESTEPSAEGGHLKSFLQLSSSQNAFTGLAGTGFSSTSFSFGSVSSEGSGSIFGTKNDKPFGLGLSTNGSSVFGASASSAISKSEGSGFAALQEVTVETGEENEKVVFNADSVLFEFVDASW
ncbi:hypothetical protein PIB30_051439, partial [Stylosanthes scabra]|nr:hypothetical protein [Stylosanthes scabra]